MGSKITRERHHRIFGSTTSSLNRADQWESPHAGLTRKELEERIKAFVERSSVPRHAPSDDKKQRHIWKNKNLADRAEMDALFGPLLWLYASITIAKEEVDLSQLSGVEKPGESSSSNVSRQASKAEADLTHSALYRRAVRAVDRVLKQNGIEATDHLNRHEQVNVSSRAEYSLLFDMITTRRVILTGIPHRIGRDIYRYVTRKYHMVKFTFVGITDNGSKRVARDIFCKDKVHNSGDDAYQKYITKSTLEVVDGNHMYVVYPEDEESIEDIIKLGIERNISESESRRMRYFTPKYNPPAIPDYIQKAEERRKAREDSEKRKSRPNFRCESCRLPILNVRSPTVSTVNASEEPEVSVLPPSPSKLSATTTSQASAISPALKLNIGELKISPVGGVSGSVGPKLLVPESGQPPQTTQRRPTFDARVTGGLTIPAPTSRKPSVVGVLSKRDFILSARKPSAIATARMGKKSSRRDTLMSEAMLQSAESRLNEINLHFRRRMKLFRYDEKKKTSLEQRNAENDREQQLLVSLAKQIEVLKITKDQVVASPQISEAWGKYT